MTGTTRKRHLLPLGPLLARWGWLLPSLLVLAAWGRSFLVVDVVHFGNWGLVTELPAAVDFVTPIGTSLADSARWHTLIREGRVDYSYLPLLRAEKDVIQTYPQRRYRTEVQVPFWALLLPTLPLAVRPWWRSRRVIRAADLGAAGRCPACGYDLRATPDRCPECGLDPAAAAAAAGILPSPSSSSSS